jgi:hypothetical protein
MHTGLLTIVVALSLLTIPLWSEHATPKNLQAEADAVITGQTCKQRLEAKRSLFEQDCAKPLPGLKPSDACSDTCDKQAAVPKDECVKNCTTCQQILEGIAYLESQCGVRF